MLTEKQIEIASGTIARVVEEKSTKGYSGDQLAKAAEATAQALVNGFAALNPPDSQTS